MSVWVEPAPRRSPDRATSHSQGGRPSGWEIAILGLAVVGVAAVLFTKVSVADPVFDELVYRDSALAYLDGDYAANREHPPLGKHIFAATLAVTGGGLEELRVLCVALMLVTGLVGWDLAYRIGGRWAAWSTAAVVWFVPVATPAMSTGVFRHALLDAPSALFGAVFLNLVWRAGTSGSPTLWAAAGVALGGSAATKISGALILAAVVPLTIWPPGHARVRPVQILIMAAAAGGTFLLTYVPAATYLFPLIGETFGRQALHAIDGHPVMVAGRAYATAPAWSHLWWIVEGQSVFFFVALFLSVGVLLSRPSTPIRYLLAAFIAPFVVLSAWPVKLPHHAAAWIVPAALVVGAAVAVADGSLRLRATRVVLIVCIVGGSVLFVGRLFVLEPGPYTGTAEMVIAAGHADGIVAITGPELALQEFLPAARFTHGFEPRPDVVVIDPWVVARDVHRDLAEGVPRLAAEFASTRVGRLEVYLRQTG